MGNNKMFWTALLAGVAVAFFGLLLRVMKIEDVIVISIGCSIIAAAIYDKLAFKNSGNVFEFYKDIHDNFGVEKIFKNRTEPQDDCRQIIEESKTELCALGHTMNRFIQQNQEQITKAAGRGVEVKILALGSKKILDNEDLFDEKFSFLRQRGVEEKVAGKDVAESCSSTIIEAVKIMNEEIARSTKGKQIELRFYTSFPVNSTLFNEKAMVAGSFFHKKESGSCYTLKLNLGELYNQYREHFFKLWKDDRFIRKCEEVLVKENKEG